RDEAAHRVGDEVDLARQVGAGIARPGDDLLNEVVEAPGRPLDVEPISGDLPMAPPQRTLDQVLMGLLGKGGSSLIVEPVNPDGRRLSEVGGRIVQDTLLAPVHVDLIALVADQPEERSFELVKGRIAIAANPDMSGPAVKSVERILYYA